MQSIDDGLERDIVTAGLRRQIEQHVGFTRENLLKGIKNGVRQIRATRKPAAILAAALERFSRSRTHSSHGARHRNPNHDKRLRG
jgi:hypothetical protein